MSTPRPSLSIKSLAANAATAVTRVKAEKGVIVLSSVILPNGMRCTIEETTDCIKYLIFKEQNEKEFHKILIPHGHRHILSLPNSSHIVTYNNGFRPIGTGAPGIIWDLQEQKHIGTFLPSLSKIPFLTPIHQGRYLVSITKEGPFEHYYALNVW